MNIKSKSHETDELFRAILLLQTKEELYKFFEDLCTVSEIQSITQRFEVACLLSDGKTYNEVSELTGASTATISRISKALLHGANGYNTAIERLKKKTDEKK